MGVKMILTVTLNPAIDRTVYVEDFKTGGLNRVKASKTYPGGKGLNVSRALCSYGLAQLATGIIGGANGMQLMALLENYDFPKDFLVVKGETRINIKVNDLKTGLITEINEPGPVISEKEAEGFIDLLKKHLENCELIVLSGSLPLGLSSGFYARCIELASEMKAKTILDADGEALSLGCRAVPFAIKPNLGEFERLTGKTFAGYREIKEEIKALHEAGIELVLVSLGKEGSILGYRGKTYHAMPLPVKVKSTVAAGDSMVAALVYCIHHGFSPEDTAAITSAAGTLTAALEGSDMSEWKYIKEEYKNVIIEEI